MPGFTSISMYPKLMEHEGTPLPQLIDRLIALAMGKAGGPPWISAPSACSTAGWAG